MAKKPKLTPEQIRYIKAAFKKNRTAMKREVRGFQQQLLDTHAELEQWLLDTGGEDPKATGDGRP